MTAASRCLRAPRHSHSRSLLSVATTTLRVVPPASLSPLATRATRLTRVSIQRPAMISGTGELRWRNDTPMHATELRFHLYWNAWRDDRSTWIRGLELEGDYRLHGRPERDRGAIDIDVDRGGRLGSDLTPAIHRARRREPGRSDGCGAAAGPCGGAGRNRQHHPEMAMRGCRARMRAPARSATTSSSRTGFQKSACSSHRAGTAISSTPLDRVLRRLRRVRRAADRPDRLDRSAQRAGRRIARTTATARRPIIIIRRMSTILRGRPARTSSSGARGSSIPASRPSRCGCCFNPSI